MVRERILSELKFPEIVWSSVPGGPCGPISPCGPAGPTGPTGP